MQHIIFAGKKSNLTQQVFIVSHFSNLILSFFGEVSFSLEFAWSCDQEVHINCRLVLFDFLLLFSQQH
jgi:hypothetical protein